MNLLFVFVTALNFNVFGEVGARVDSQNTIVNTRYIMLNAKASTNSTGAYLWYDLWNRTLSEMSFDISAGSTILFKAGYYTPLIGYMAPQKLPERVVETTPYFIANNNLDAPRFGADGRLFFLYKDNILGFMGGVALDSASVKGNKTYLGKLEILNHVYNTLFGMTGIYRQEDSLITANIYVKTKAYFSTLVIEGFYNENENGAYAEITASTLNNFNVIVGRLEYDRDTVERKRFLAGDIVNVSDIIKIGVFLCREETESNVYQYAEVKTNLVFRF